MTDAFKHIINCIRNNSLLSIPVYLTNVVYNYTDESVCGVGGVMCVPEMISGYLESFGIVNHYRTFLILFVMLSFKRFNFCVLR